MTLQWHKRGQDFFSNSTGRFDLLRSAVSGWILFDWEAGLCNRGSREACEQTAAIRFGVKAAAAYLDAMKEGK